MARETDAAITFNDAQYMVDNEGFTALQSIPSSNECMTRSEITSYINADDEYQDFETYASNELVPYQKLTPLVRACSQEYTGNNGSYTYTVDFGSGTGWIGIKYDAGRNSTGEDLPDKFTLYWNGNTISTGYVGHSIYDQDLIDAGISQNDINTDDPNTSEGIIFINKNSASPSTATVTVEAPLGTTWWSIEGTCPATLSPSLTISPSSNSVSTSSGSVTVSVTSNTMWTVSDNASWVSLSHDKSGGSRDVTINYTSNSGGSRNATITFQSLEGSITRTFSLSQASSTTTYSKQLGNGSTSTLACDDNFIATFYLDDSDFLSATKLWTNSGGTNYANAGWYSDGTTTREWSGTAFIGNAQLCVK